MICVGLDLSTSTGVALVKVEGEKMELLSADLLEVDTGWHKKMAMSAGVAPEFAYISQAENVANLIYDILSRVNLKELGPIVIEQTNLGMSRTNQKELEFVHFAVLKMLRSVPEFEARTEYVDSSKWRSLCGMKLTKEQRAHNKAVKTKAAKGKITWKHLSVAWVNAKFGLNFLIKDNDKADAICLACSGIELQKFKRTSKIDVDSIFQS